MESSSNPAKLVAPTTGELTPAAVQAAELSVVVPMRNESANLEELFARLLRVLERIGASFEVICVNDGSTDDTLAGLLAMRERNPAVKIVSLSRNFGKDVALSAGLDYARGSAVVLLDSDLQDPPELIEPMIEKWREGYDVVYATRADREGETLAKRLTAYLFYRIFDRVTDVPIPRDTGDFRVLDRRVVEVLARLPERSRFMKGLFAWVGFKQTAIVYQREPRHAGHTNWNYWRLWNFAIDAVTSFSSVPLKIWSYLGLVISIFAFLYALFLTILKLGKGIDVPGYTSLMVVVLFFGGVQLITLGVIGEYLSRVYNEVKGRPLYLVRDLWGFDDRSRGA
ncbi:MAG TPA: glycosyltransferase family 2 protein [Candidatus Binataceae bacterium]|nr:glycosyltransferase family 2 protein [Candidatus Binataceae bacterium]